MWKTTVIRYLAYNYAFRIFGIIMPFFHSFNKRLFYAHFLHVLYIVCAKFLNGTLQAFYRRIKAWIGKELSFYFVN